MSDKPRGGAKPENGWLHRLAATFGMGNDDPRVAISEAVREAAADGQLSADEAALIEAALRLGALTADDLCAARGAVEAIGAHESVARAISRLAGDSWLPVIGETVDDPRGSVTRSTIVVWLAARAGNDIAAALATRLCDAGVIERGIEVPSAMHVSEVLATMQRSGAELAFIINEYGGIDGYLTRDMIVAAMLPSAAATVVSAHGDDGTIDARLPVETLEARLGRPLGDAARDDVETVGGMIFSMLGRVPDRGETVRHPAGVHMQIVEVDRRRIARVRILEVEDAASATAA